MHIYAQGAVRRQCKRVVLARKPEVGVDLKIAPAARVEAGGEVVAVLTGMEAEAEAEEEGVMVEEAVAAAAEDAVAETAHEPAAETAEEPVAEVAEASAAEPVEAAAEAAETVAEALIEVEIVAEPVVEVLVEMEASAEEEAAQVRGDPVISHTEKNLH
jgi:septal ring-binding cell division protein DamX